MMDPNRIWSSAQLPSLPVAAMRMLELARDPEAGVADFVQVIQSDPATAARILKAANSSFFGLAQRVQTVDRAVVLLGTTSVVALALGFSLVDGAAVPEKLKDAYASFWLQSAVQSAAASSLSQQLTLGRSDEAMLAGLLLDLGRLAMLRTIPEEYALVCESSISLQRPIHEVETELLGLDHVRIGTELGARWKLPDSLHQAIGLHHAPLAKFPTDKKLRDLNLWRVATVAAAVGDYYCGAGKGMALERLRELTTRFWSMPPARLTEFLEGLHSRVEEAAALFSIKTKGLCSNAELLAQANEQLSLLAMSAQAETTQALIRQEFVEQENKSLEARNEQLLEQALRDPLTGLYNRRFFEDTMSREVARCAADGTPLGIVFFDVDHFKKLNDTYGHAWGDEVLRQVGRSLAEMVRDSDVLARYGGEEFVILVNQPTVKGLEKIAERLRSRVEEERFILNGKMIGVTISVGTAISIPKRNDLGASAELVQAADEAMYESKRGGRNRVTTRSLLSDFEHELMVALNHKRFSRWLVSCAGLDILDVSRALLRADPHRETLGEIARQYGALSEDQVAAILESQNESNLRFGEAAVRRGDLDPDRLALLLALQREDPRELRRNLVRAGLVDEAQSLELLNRYFAEHPGFQFDYPEAPEAAEPCVMAG